MLLECSRGQNVPAPSPKHSEKQFFFISESSYNESGKSRNFGSPDPFFNEK